MKRLSIVILTLNLILGLCFPAMLKAQDQCGRWVQDGSSYISLRGCSDQFGYKSHQFFNGYAFKVHFWVVLMATDGSTSGQDLSSGYYINIYLNPNETSDRAANDFSTGVNKEIANWRITKKQRQKSDGTWEDFF